jgi:hypothetical protein
MFVPCIIRRSRNNQQYALICITPLFYVLAPKCFGSSLPSSGSFLDPSELLEIQIEWVVYHIMWGYVACVPDCRGSVCCASQLSAYFYKYKNCYIQTRVPCRIIVVLREFLMSVLLGFTILFEKGYFFTNVHRQQHYDVLRSV